jgi:transcriptional regulator with GAF, ATPase, and Fis domain
MLKYRFGEVNNRGGGERLTLHPSSNALKKRSWRNWFLLSGVALVTTIGLGTAIPPFLGMRSINPWPWEKTDLVLIAGLSIIVLAFIVYLTQQQRRVIGIYSQLQELKNNNSETRSKHVSRLYGLFNISRIIGSETDLRGVFDGVTKICVETFNCHRASLMLYDSETEELAVMAAHGRNSQVIIGTRQKIGEGIAGYAARRRESLMLQGHADLDKYPGLKLENPSIASAIVVPIILRNELVGVLNVSNHSPDVQYDGEDLRALQVFAENAGAFIRHTEHAQWMRQTIQRLEAALREKNKLLKSAAAKSDLIR